MEYHCKECKPTHKGRFFKRPDADDLDRYERARLRLLEEPELPIPDDEIPRGTRRIASIAGATGATGRCLPTVSYWD